jgi:hypothetical protein
MLNLRVLLLLPRQFTDSTESGLSRAYQICLFVPDLPFRFCCANLVIPKIKMIYCRLFFSFGSNMTSRMC